MKSIDQRAHTWRVLLSLPGRVGMVAPVTDDDLQRMSAAGVVVASTTSGASRAAAGSLVVARA